MHRCRVMGEEIKGDVRGNFFIQKMANSLKVLLERMTEAGTLTAFKTYRDEHLNCLGIWDHAPSTGRLGLMQKGARWFVWTCWDEWTISMLYISMTYLRSENAIFDSRPILKY